MKSELNPSEILKYVVAGALKNLLELNMPYLQPQDEYFPGGFLGDAQEVPERSATPL